MPLRGRKLPQDAAPDGPPHHGPATPALPAEGPPRAALLAVRPARGLRAAVVEGDLERAHVEPRLPRDLDLHGPSVDPAPVEGPRPPQGPEVPPALVAALELRGLRRAARGPRG